MWTDGPSVWPQESKHPCCPRYISHSFGEHPQRFPWRHQEFVMPGKTQTTATQSCKWKHIKKQLKKSSPADPRQEGKACFRQENAQAVPKNTYPSVDLITLQVIHILLENLQVEHVRNIPPYLSPFYHVLLKNHNHLYWLKFTLHRNTRNRIKINTGYF